MSVIKDMSGFGLFERTQNFGSRFVSDRLLVVGEEIHGKGVKVSEEASRKFDMPLHGGTHESSLKKT
jgi:hypothetical protein